MRYADRLKKKLFKTIGVGTIVRLKIGMLGNDAGTLGIGFNDYGDGCQVIFQNGQYDGFSKDEQMQYLEYVAQSIDPNYAFYEFKNVIKTCRDFDSCFFDLAWKLDPKDLAKE